MIKNKKRNIWIIIMLFVVGLGVFSYPYIKNGYALWMEQTEIREQSAEILKNIDLPKKLENQLLVYGNPKADKVILNSAGGPATILDITGLRDVVSRDGGINPNDFLVVGVRQCQTLRSKEMEKREITFEEAKKCDEESVKTLADTVAFFKEKNKKVYVLGMSFGAFVVTDLLANYGNTADKYAIVVGRLNMQDRLWKGFMNGSFMEYRYDKDGNEKIIEINVEESESKEGESIEDKNMGRLAAGLGYKRYVELLKDKKLDNVTYVYGNRDQHVGRLAKESVDFLKSKGVKVYEIDGGHSQTMEEFLEKYLKDIFSNTNHDSNEDGVEIKTIKNKNEINNPGASPQGMNLST